jgi:hypothetical protein
MLNKKKKSNNIEKEKEKMLQNDVKINLNTTITVIQKV